MGSHNEKGTAIYSFVVLHEGWEMDNTAWVMQGPSGERWIETTNHGGRCVASLAEFVEKLKEYQGAVETTKKELEMIGYVHSD